MRSNRNPQRRWSFLRNSDTNLGSRQSSPTESRVCSPEQLLLQMPDLWEIPFSKLIDCPGVYALGDVITYEEKYPTQGHPQVATGRFGSRSESLANNLIAAQREKLEKSISMIETWDPWQTIGKKRAVVRIFVYQNFKSLFACSLGYLSTWWLYSGKKLRLFRIF